MTNPKIRLRNHHPTQGKVARVSHALIWNFPICTCEMNKDQFGLFLFSKMLKHPSSSTKVKKTSKMSIYCQGYVSYRETIRFDSKH